MVFTLRFILGIFLVLISCTVIQSHSLRPRNIRETIPEDETNKQNVSNYESLKITTLRTVAKQDESKEDKSTQDVPKNDVPKTEINSTDKINKIPINEVKNYEGTSTTGRTSDKNNVARTENARSLDYDISKYLSPEFHNKNNVYNAPTSPENQKYVHSDVNLERKPLTFSSYSYLSEISTKSNDYIDDRFKSVEQGIRQDLDDVDAFFQSTERDVEKKPNLDELFDKAKINNTKSNLDFVRYEKVENDNQPMKRKNHQTEKGININFDSIYNETKYIDEGFKIIKRPTTIKPIKLVDVPRLDNKIKIGDSQERTERNFITTTKRVNYPTKSYFNRTRDQNALISNKIETELSKLVTEQNTEQTKFDPTKEVAENYEIKKVINVYKRGSTKYQGLTTTEDYPKYSSKFSSPIQISTPRMNTIRLQTSNQLPNVLKRMNTSHEQTVQENNIHPIIVPFVTPSDKELTTMQMYEVTDESIEASTIPMEIKLNPTTHKDDNSFKSTTLSEVFYEMTGHSTTMSPDSTIFDTTTDQQSTTEIHTETTSANEDHVLTTDLYEATTQESTTDFTTESSIEIYTNSPTFTESTTEGMTSTEYTTTLESITTEINNNQKQTTDIPLANTTLDKSTEQIHLKEINEHVSVGRNFKELESTTLFPIELTTINDYTSTASETTTNIDVTTELFEEITTVENAISKDEAVTQNSNENITEKANEIIQEGDKDIKSHINETNSIDKLITTFNKTNTQSTEKPFDIKENDISKENVTKNNSTEPLTVELEDDDDLDDSEYVEVQSKKPAVIPNIIPEEIEIIPIEPVVKFHTTLQPEINNAYPSPEIVTVKSTTTENVVTDEETNVTTSGEAVMPDSNDDDGGNSGTIIAIVISSVGAACLILLAGLLLIMRRRQKRFNYGQRCTPVSLDAYSMDNVSVQNSVRRKALMRGSKRSYGNPAFDDPSSITHPLNFQALARFATNVEEIKVEYEEIPQVTAKMNELPEGCDTKNRYANVIPLPETRVFLSTVSDDPTSDYINANFVTGPKGARGYYIACQAPLQNTIDDFWRMVWEQQSKVILMVTHLFENGMEKCVDYLPPSEVLDCHRLFGDFQVTLKNREVKDKYIISSLQLKNMVSNSWREVTHMWYSGWPEKGVPDEENSLIAFLIEARSYIKLVQNTMELKTNETLNGRLSNGMRNPETSPVVVHCSPGTGRTGTVIACDIAIREFELKRLVDIPRIVYMIRRDRASAVQTKDQYAFIYKVINLYATKLTGGALDSI